MNARRRSRGTSSRELPLVRQSRGNDCGPAALATVAARHGRSFDYGKLCDDHVPVDRRGTDLLALSRLAERLGFETRGIRASYDEISMCTLPAIAHVRRRVGGGHFVVVDRWTPAQVLLADPGRGQRTLSRRAFSRRWTGYLLIIQPTPTNGRQTQA